MPLGCLIQTETPAARVPHSDLSTEAKPHEGDEMLRGVVEIRRLPAQDEEVPLRIDPCDPEGEEPAVGNPPLHRTLRCEGDAEAMLDKILNRTLIVQTRNDVQGVAVDARLVEDPLDFGARTADELS